MLDFDGKFKAFTFSYDDGVLQDKRLLHMLNKYNLKATFNLNSGRFRKEARLIRDGKEIEHIKVQASEEKELCVGT